MTHPIEIDTANAEFQNALKLIQYTRQSVFLTGKAGTGKSTFLKYICQTTKKKYVVLAPTGIAAINAGGSTLHSFFKLPFHPLLPDDPNFSLRGNKLQSFLKYTADRRKLIKNIELVIIDEISMVRADIIDFIDKVLRVYSQNMREPFGGKQLLLVGDVYQLEPVVKNDEREIINRFYPNPYFFSARVFADQGVQADRPRICQRARPHPHQYRRLCRLTTAQHPLSGTTGLGRERPLHHIGYPARQRRLHQRTTPCRPARRCCHAER